MHLRLAFWVDRELLNLTAALDARQARRQTNPEQIAGLISIVDRGLQVNDIAHTEAIARPVGCLQTHGSRGVA